MKRLFLLLGLAFVLAGSSFAQPRFAAKVVDAVDGRTLLVETSAGRVTVQLQYIEVPEPEQPLHAVAREHIKRIAAGRVVEYQPMRILDTRTVGRVRLGGVDIGLQMIRDGAAWHEPATQSGQEPAEAFEYAENQEKARTEKRGVWSVPGMKTPWQVRAERDEAARKQEAAKNETRPKVIGVSQYQTANRPGEAVSGSWTPAGQGKDLSAWADVFAGVGKETVGLQTYSDPQGRFDVLYTSAAFVDLDAGRSKMRVECRALAVYVKLPNGTQDKVYVMAFRSIAEDFYFSKRSGNLSFSADGKNFSAGTPYNGMRGESSVGNHELFFYRLNKTTLRSIANARKVDVRIDGTLGTLSGEARDLFKQLVATAD